VRSNVVDGLPRANPLQSALREDENDIEDDDNERSVIVDMSR